MGVGAAISTALGGAVAYRFGAPAAFMMLAAIGLAGFLLYALAMPETRHPETDPSDEIDPDTDT
jgi:predicted MFS family arabinose efflux permease